MSVNGNKLDESVRNKLISTVKSNSVMISTGKYCPITINDVFTKALIDSGNSAGTCISYKFAKKIGLTRDDLTGEAVEIGTAKKNSSLTVLGKTKAPIWMRIGGLQKRYKLRPYVIKNFSSEVNISLCFLERHKIDQIHSKQCLKVDGKLVRLHDARGVLHVDEVNEKRAARTETAEAYVNSDCTIPPNCAKFITLKIPKMQRGFMKISDGVISADEKFIQRNDIHPCKEAAVRVNKHGIIKVPVLNTLDSEVKINANQKFGTFTHIVFKKEKPAPTKLNWSDEKIRQEFALDKADALTSEQDVQKAIRFLKQFGGLYSENDSDFGETDIIEHDIYTQNAPPIRQKSRPMNPAVLDNLEKQVKTWKKADIIEEANSPWNSRLVPIPKKDGRIRWCVDYRELNKVTIKDSFPLPNIDESLSRMANCKIFSAIDGTGAYHVVKVNESHREKTAFSCHLGQFQFKRLPFGLCNAPSTYARLVHKVLEGLDRRFLANYLDDTSIFSKSLDDHFRHLTQVFEAHRNAGIKLAPRKCQLFRSEIEFLGHVVSRDGIKTNPDNVAKINSWKIKTLEDLHTFVGKCIYYGKYVPDFATKIYPLQALLNKDNMKNKKKELMLTDSEKQCVDNLKKALTSAPILAYPDFASKEPFILDTDWSHDPGAIGGVLSQKQNGMEKVIAYGARKLKASERNYGSNKGELLAVIHFMEKWKFYLWPRKFVLRTDHRALRWIKEMEVPNPMATR